MPFCEESLPVAAFAQRKLQLSSHTYQKRMFTTKTYQKLVSPPDNLSTSNLHGLFESIIAHLDNQRSIREDKDCSNTVHLVKGPPMNYSSLKEKLSQAGAKVKIKWTAEEIGDSGWRPGRYVRSICASLC